LRRVVLDSSVVAKWLPILSHEPLVREARELRRQWETGEIVIAAPDFFWVEVAAILWKAQRRGICTVAAAETALKDLLSLNIPTVDSYSLMEATLQAAIRYERSVCDSVYIALARALDAEFLTADETLVNAVSRRLPVEWLGTFSA